LYGITSERKLVEELRMHLAWRWFTGLGFDQEIPHHSTFSKNRHGRFQESKLFEELFERIVRQCMEVGLVQGKHRSVDGSFVEANAAKESRIPREQLAEAAQVHHTVRQYLREVEEQNPVEEQVHEQEQVSTTDPDSTYATKGGTPARLGYYDNYLVDNSSCVIVGVHATAARMSQETVAAQDMLTRFAAWQGREPELARSGKHHFSSIGRFCYRASRRRSSLGVGIEADNSGLGVGGSCKDREKLKSFSYFNHSSTRILQRC
jgi:IS5 family transposase